MSAPTDARSRSWPLTGRHEDLDALRDAIEAGSAAVFIGGEPGTGKTRVARELLRLLESDGWSTAAATATESARSTPLGALAHLVPPGAVADPPTVFGATRDALVERGEGRPVVLLVDDAHHLDSSSASLLVSLAESGAVRLVITLRSGQRAPEAVTALRAGEGVLDLVLGPLDPLALDTLLHRVLGAPLDGLAEAKLLETSAGNPLFLRELVLGALADGSLHDGGGVWRLSGPLPAGAALRDRVLGRMEALSDEAREALELVAVASDIGLDRLEAMVDPAVLEQLEEQGLIKVEVDQRRHRVRLGHPVYGEILRSTMGRMRFRRHSRRHAESVAALGARRRDDGVRLVRWQLDAGMVPDTDVVLAAAQVARHHHDWITVASLARIALQAGAPDAAALVAEAHFELGEFEEVDAVVAAALESELSEATRVQLTRSRALSLMWGHDDAEAAVALIESVAGGVTDPDLAELLLFARAAILVWAARVAEGATLVEGLLESDEPRVAVQAALVAELVAATCGPVTRAIELADEWFSVHLALPAILGTNNPGNHLLTKTVALAHAGRLAEAAELADFAYQASVANRSTIGQMWFSLELGRIALMRGDAATARRWFREQIALCRGTGHRRPVTLGLSGLAIAEAHLGDAAAAADAIAEIDADPTAVIPLFAVEQARGAAWAKVAAGDPEAARRLLIEGAEHAEEAGVWVMAGFARLDALRLGSADQAEPLAAAAAAAGGSAILELATAWAGAPNDGAALEAIAAQLEGLGVATIAAECFAAAAGAHRRAGEPRKAAAAEQRADGLARRAGGTATPGLTTVDSVVPLTAREREIAVLVAEGLTTKEVAERLFVSARTVSNHLQNAYTKLGISKRTELASALGRLGGVE